MTQNKKHRFWIIFIPIVVVLILFSTPILRSIGDYLIVHDSLRQADLITAVSGPEYRINYAADLYKRGLGARLFFTGGYSDKNMRYEANWSKYLALAAGVPEEAITVDDESIISTYQEAVRLQKYIEAHPDQIKTIILVTDAYHTRRARWAYQKVLGDQVKILMAPVPFDKTGYTRNWWMNAQSRKMVFDEYFKFTFYLFRYQLTTGKLQKWLAQFDRF